LGRCVLEYARNGVSELLIFQYAKINDLVPEAQELYGATHDVFHVPFGLTCCRLGPTVGDSFCKYPVPANQWTLKDRYMGVLCQSSQQAPPINARFGSQVKR